MAGQISSRHCAHHCAHFVSLQLKSVVMGFVSWVKVRDYVKFILIQCSNIVN